MIVLFFRTDAEAAVDGRLSPQQLFNKTDSHTLNRRAGSPYHVGREATAEEDFLDFRLRQTILSYPFYRHINQFELGLHEACRRNLGPGTNYPRDGAPRLWLTEFWLFLPLCSSALARYGRVGPVAS